MRESITTVNDSTVVTGISLLCSIGNRAEVVWDSLMNKKQNLRYRDYSINHTTIGSYYYHPINSFSVSNSNIDFDIWDWITETRGDFKDKDLEYFAASISDAIEDSRLEYECDDNRVGLVLVHENPGLENFFNETIHTSISAVLKHLKESKKNNHDLRAKVVSEVASVNMNIGYNTQSFMLLFYLCKLFSFHGSSIILNNACASGLYALEQASMMITSGICETVIVSGMDSCDLPYKHLWLQSLGLYSSDGLIRPYLRNRNGFVLGEGGATLIIEKRSAAKKRSIDAYCSYTAGAVALECGKISTPSIKENHYESCIKQCLKKSNLSIDDIDLVNAHGIGTGITDLYEYRQFKKVFGISLDKLMFLALKPYFGHTLGSAALLECAVVIMCMKHSLIPGNMHSHPLDDEIKLFLPTESCSKKIKHVLKTACGFGGFQAACILSKEENF